MTNHTFVDGGALSNFPINLLTSRDSDVVKVMGDTDPDAVPNLGFLIDERIPVPGSGSAEEEEGTEDTEGGMLHNIKYLRTVRRIKRLVDTITQAHDLQSIEAHMEEICFLPAKGYGTTEFDMSDARLKALVSAGRDAMKRYLDQRPLPA